MPQYVVQLEGGGEMRVNASSPQAAADNVRSTGNTPAGSGGGGGGGSSAPAATTSSGGGQVYSTINGPKTMAQMTAELNEAGWGGGEDVATAYARTAGGTVTPQSTTTSTAQNQLLNPNVPTLPAANLGQFNQDLDAAQKAAYQAYLNAKLNLDSDTLAFQKAQQAFAETISRAQQTGVFEGQPTLAAQKQAADLLGTYQGQQTLAAQKQAADIAAQQAGLTGLFGGQTTLPAQQQYWQQAFNQQTQNQKVVQDYLSLLSTLRGPQDYGQYLRTLASTPQGLQSLVSAAASSNPVAAFGTTGTPTQPVTLGGFMGQAAGGAAPAGGGATGGTSYADYMRAASNLPPPSQIAPQNWNAMTDSQKQVLLSMYESQGWNVNDVANQYAASLPKFGSTSPQTGNVRLV